MTLFYFCINWKVWPITIFSFLLNDYNKTFLIKEVNLQQYLYFNLTTKSFNVLIILPRLSNPSLYSLFYIDYQISWLSNPPMYSLVYLDYQIAIIYRTCLLFLYLTDICNYVNSLKLKELNLTDWAKDLTSGVIFTSRGHTYIVQMCLYCKCMIFLWTYTT